MNSVTGLIGKETTLVSEMEEGETVLVLGMMGDSLPASRTEGETALVLAMGTEVALVSRRVGEETVLVLVIGRDDKTEPLASKYSTIFVSIHNGILGNSTTCLRIAPAIEVKEPPSINVALQFSLCPNV